MRRKLGIVIINVNLAKTVFLAVVAVTAGRAANWHANQAEGIVYSVLVVIVAPSLEVVNGGSFDRRGGIIKVVSFEKTGSEDMYRAGGGSTNRDG